MLSVDFENNVSVINVLLKIHMLFEEMKYSNVSYLYCFCVLNVYYLYVTSCLFFEEMEDSYVSDLHFIYVSNVFYFLISTFTLCAVFN